jgi:hypothetical protein
VHAAPEGHEGDGDRALSSVGARDVAIGACAASALVHAVLAPEHFSEHPLVALSFAAATGVLLLLALALTRPWLRWAPPEGAALFAALIVAYPLVHVFTNEGTDALGIGTKLVEAVGLVACLRAARDNETAPLAPLDVITGVFAAMILLSFGHHH